MQHVVHLLFFFFNNTKYYYLHLPQAFGGRSDMLLQQSLKISFLTFHYIRLLMKETPSLHSSSQACPSMLPQGNC